MRDILDFLGRMLLSSVFLYEAYDFIAFFEKAKTKMTASGFIQHQESFIYFFVFLLILGGLMLLLGYRSTLGALLLFCYLAIYTFWVNDYWNYANLDDRRLQSALFIKNIAILGGLLMIMAHGTGRYAMRSLLATTKVH